MLALGNAATSDDERTSFAAFCEALGHHLDLDLNSVSPEVALATGLGWDSLTLIEALALIDQHDDPLPDELLAEIHTLADLHALWSRRGSAPPSPAAALEGTNVRLVPFTNADLDWAFGIHTSGPNLAHYRTRAITPSLESFHRLVWEGVVDQFMVVTHTGTRVGLVSCFNADYRNRHAHLAAITDPRWLGTGLALQGLGLLVDWVFSQFDLRKLYLETFEDNLDRYRSGEDRLFTVEGRLVGHEFVDGRWADLVIAAVHRTTWDEHRTRLLGRSAGS